MPNRVTEAFNELDAGHQQATMHLHREARLGRSDIVNLMSVTRRIDGPFPDSTTYALPSFDLPVTVSIFTQITTLATLDGIIFEWGDSTRNFGISWDSTTAGTINFVRGNTTLQSVAGVGLADGQNVHFVLATHLQRSKLWANGKLIADLTATDTAYATDSAIGVGEVNGTSRLGSVTLVNGLITQPIRIYHNQLPRQFAGHE